MNQKPIAVEQNKPIFVAQPNNLLRVEWANRSKSAAENRLNAEKLSGCSDFS